MFDLREISVMDSGDAGTSPTLAGKRQKPSLFHRAEVRSGRSVYLSRFCPKGHSVFVGRSSGTSDLVTGWLGRMGAGLLRLSRDCLALSWIAQRAETLDFIIVDAGAFDCADEMRRLCEALQRIVPTLPVVLLAEPASTSANGEAGPAPSGVTECTASDETAFVRALRLAREGCPRLCSGTLAAASPVVLH